MPRLRLFIDMPFSEGALISLKDSQLHYVRNVMRGKVGEQVQVFNGEQGHWYASIESLEKKHGTLVLGEQVMEQRASPDVWLVFAPIKAKNEWMVEKATEMGVSRIVPVMARRCVVTKVNHEKLSGIAIEAAQQCERHDVPQVAQANTLESLLADWPKDRILLHADEHGGCAPLKHVLEGLSKTGGACAVLIGPEGGFTPEERAMLLACEQAHSFGMGPRILRADTASVAALANIMSWLGDWHHAPRFEEG